MQEEEASFHTPPRERSEPTEPLGATIKRLRLERGLGQERLAIQAGIDQSGLSNSSVGRTAG